MTQQFLTSYKIYLIETGTPDTWHDITDTVVTDSIIVDWGIRGSGPADRISSVGVMTFTLKNDDNLYTPGYSVGIVNSWALWKLGAKIVLQMVYEGDTYNRFRGVVDHLGIIPGKFGGSRVRVRVVDWLDYTSKHPLTALDIQYDETADVAVDAIVEDMPIAPQDTALDVGNALFPAIFDTVTRRSVGYSELSKIVMSEMGYLYLRHDTLHGETLVFESFSHRNFGDLPRDTNLVTEGLQFLETEDGLDILMADTVFVVANSMAKAEIRYGEAIINRVEVTAFPKQIDTVGNEVVLYKLASPLLVGAGQVITFNTTYTDPTGAGRQCTADPATMIAPVATTHYLANTLANGSGTNLTANFTVVADYGITGVEYTITNGSVYLGYLTFLQAKGLGIYSYNPISSIVESPTSYNEYGFKTLTVRQTYQRDLIYGSLVAEMILDDNKQPRTKLESLTFCANRSVDLMRAFLQHDIGNLVQVQMDDVGIDGYFFIQAIKFSIGLGGLITNTWMTKQLLVLQKGLSFIGAEFTIAGNGRIGYGYLPHITGKNKRSISVWIYPKSEGEAIKIVAGAYGSNGGWYLYTSNGYCGLFQSGSPDPGQWYGDQSLTLNAWSHIVITRDCTLATNQPKIYINATLVTTVELQAQSGALLSEVGSQFAIGNSYVDDFPFDGIIEDVRYYGRILEQYDVANLVGSHYAIYDTLFMGPVVRTSEALYYKDLTLSDEDKVLDAAYGIVGSRANTVVTREAVLETYVP